MNRSYLTTPTPWIAVGMGLVLGLVCLLLGGGVGFANWLLASYQSQGFPELTAVSESSATSLIVMVVTTFAAVFSLEGTPGTGRRVMLLVSGLVVLVLASPVFALWGIFWSPAVNVVSILWAGIAAMVHAANRDPINV